MIKCRFCKNEQLELILDLGFCPLVDSFLKKEKLQEPETYYPLQVFLCENCGLSQLGYVPPLEQIFNNEYAYEAGTTKTRRKSHFEMAKSICDRFKVSKDSLVVDIGSNVGVLLEGFREQGVEIMGVDASDNVAEIARKNGINTITGFFGPDIAKQISLTKRASVITATNVFAHMNDYDNFLEGIDILLKDDGVFVFQVHYLLDLIEGLQYDMIFHEHILFESIKPLISLFNRLNMDLFDVERFTLDGGVIRCYVGKKNIFKISDNLKKLLIEEENAGIHKKEKLLIFSQKVQEHREELIKLLNDLKRQGKKIIAFSMPAKGVALLNYCKIDTRIIDYATEGSSLKIGKFSPGSHIPIKSDDALLNDPPDYALLLAWNFETEIVKKNQDFLKQGGKFIVPIPKPRIVEEKIN
tara:strand:+ start:547 stop:1782 length:1236 start_codon:yes stop_codon:yes gene_type:complete